ncbi:hypothetical protein ACHMW7_16095 [Aminobacter sp. UC22_36]|uniref:hypothetical protein n=1 Tax=Aminobacter sp. UC22_36 TaxID=3374549 RepID=UPI00375724E3
MTPKEMYDARKAARKKLAEDQQISWQARQAREQADMFDIADRFVTAMERIADAMEAAR